MTERVFEKLGMGFTAAHSLASKLLSRKSLMLPEEVAEVLHISRLTVLRWAKKRTSIRSHEKQGNVRPWQHRTLACVAWSEVGLREAVATLTCYNFDRHQERVTPR